MIIDHPQTAHIPALRRLWQQAFGDADSFLDSFFHLGFDPRRCRCAFAEGRPMAALYWFDCACRGRRIAYLYAIATEKEHRGKGICRALMDDTHTLLKDLGYSAAVLVPGEESLFRFYGAMGYGVFSSVSRRQVAAGAASTPLRPVDPKEYALLRRKLLPEGGIVQEGAFLDLLADQFCLFAGDDLVLCAAVDKERLIAQEYLGDFTAAPGILTSLGLKTGLFRAPGKETPFAMGLSLDAGPLPNYLGLAMD